MDEFRTLRADEIEVRVQSVRKGNNAVGAILLLYKDARCDMNILDESVGLMGWKREHNLIGDRLYCTVSLFDKDSDQWISKQDVGTESNTEAEKGQASDAFKRACFNWGIGRELYTAPFIYITLKNEEFYEDRGKLKLKSGVSFRVESIEYKNRRISSLMIVDKNGERRYQFDTEKKQTHHNRTKEEQEKSLQNSIDEVRKRQKRLSDLEVDIYGESFKQWMCDHTGYADQNADLQDEIKNRKLINAYDILIAGKEKQIKESANANTSQA